MNPYIQIIAAFFGSLGFALLFNLRGQWLFFTALGGGLSWCVYLISGSFISHYERQYFAAAFFLRMFAERGLEAVITGGAIASGIITAMVCWNVIKLNLLKK